MSLPSDPSDDLGDLGAPGDPEASGRSGSGAGEPPRPWRRSASRPGPDLIVARARFDTLANPRTGDSHERLVLEAPGWVNIVARTRSGAFVFVRQFRFGTEVVTTEIPGGVVDPGEDPAETARRELREETGFTTERWSLLADIAPNPAFLNNRCFQYLAEDCELTHPTELDPGEDIQVVLLEEAEVLAAVRAGGIDHSLVISALARVLDLRNP